MVWSDDDTVLFTLFASLTLLACTPTWVNFGIALTMFVCNPNILCVLRIPPWHGLLSPTSASNITVTNKNVTTKTCWPHVQHLAYGEGGHVRQWVERHGSLSEFDMKRCVATMLYFSSSLLLDLLTIIGNIPDLKFNPQ